MSLWGKFVAKIPNFGGFGAAFPHLENYSWTGLLLAIEHKTVDVDTAFAEFNAIVNYFVEKYIPSRTVCTVSRFTYLGSDIDSDGYSYPEIFNLQSFIE